MKRKLIEWVSVGTGLFVATPAFANMNGGVGMYNGYANVASGFTMILVWIVLLLLIGVLWKNLHH